MQLKSILLYRELIAACKVKVFCARAMILCQLLLLCLLGLGSAVDQPSSRFVRQSSCSNEAAKLDEIQGTLVDIKKAITDSYKAFERTFVSSIDKLVGE